MSHEVRREAVFEPDFLDDLVHWIRTDQKPALRTFKLVNLTLRDPFRGGGKPKPLGKSLGGLWSRRITEEHRLVYKITSNQVRFISARFHYTPNLGISLPTLVHHALPQTGDAVKDHRREGQVPIPQVAPGTRPDGIDSVWALDDDWRALLDDVWQEDGD